MLRFLLSGCEAILRYFFGFLLVMLNWLPGFNNLQPTKHQQLQLTRENYNVFRLLLIVDQVARPVMVKILKCGAKRKIPSEKLKQYLIREKGFSNVQYRKTFNKTMRERIESDASCEGYDISLLLPAIEWGCDDLAPPGDDIWFKSPASLENHLKRLKDARNDLCHKGFSISTPEFVRKVEELRNLIINAWKLAGAKYSVDSDRVNEYINDLNDHINQIRDTPLNQLDLKSYANTALFKELQKMLLEVGKKDLVELFQRFTNINPAALIIGYEIHLKVETIFTALELVEEGRHKSNAAIDYTSILEYAHKQKKKSASGVTPIILFEGVAGAGKTTLVKMLLSDWSSGICSVKELDKYSLVFIMECRNRIVSSLTELISCQMPTARKSFQHENHMMECLLDLPFILIVDGLDEVNSVSEQLFTEIVNHKRLKNSIVICTTRPEKVNDYYTMIPDDVHTIHIKMNGIYERDQPKFLQTYHDTLRHEGYSHQSTEGLIKYFQTTGTRLKDHWKIPLNLTLLTILWVVDPGRVNLVTTATELLLQIHELTVAKLLKRLCKYDHVKVMQHEEIKKKVEAFITALCKLALVGLKENAIILQEEEVQILKNICNSLSLPSEEALGAFLIQKNAWSPTGIEIQFNFPHKVIQDHFASNYIYNQVFKANKFFDVKNCMDILSTHNVPAQLRQELEILLMSYELGRSQPRLSVNTADQNNKTIEDVLKDVLDQDIESLQLQKYQNVFISLIGLLYNSGRDVDEILVKEIIGLLKRSGVSDRDEWIRVLNSVKCNDMVARVIVDEIPHIMDGTIEIDDGNVFAYASLMKEKSPESVEITIDTNPEDVPRLDDVLGFVSEHECLVEELRFEYSFSHPEKTLGITPLKENLKQLFARCQVVTYKGSVCQGMNLPHSLTELSAGVADSNAFQALTTFLGNPKTQLKELEIQGDITDVEELSRNIMAHDKKLNRISLHQHFRNPQRGFRMGDPFSQMLHKKCPNGYKLRENRADVRMVTSFERIDQIPQQ